MSLRRAARLQEAVKPQPFPGPSKRERQLLRRAGCEVAPVRDPDAEFAGTMASIAASNARVDDALARLDANIQRSREFWAEQEAAREADSWEAAWREAGL